MLKDSLTVLEIEELMEARLNLDSLKLKRLQARIGQALGADQAAIEDPEEAELQQRYIKWVCKLVAGRLKNDNRAVPLLTLEDVEQFMATEHFCEECEVEPCQEEAFSKFKKTFFQNLLDTANGALGYAEDLYAEYWRWAEAMVNLSAERGVAPLDLFGSAPAGDVADEITRRMYSKEEYVSLSKKTADKMASFDVVEKRFFEPLLDIVGALDESKREEMRQEMEQMVMPQLREHFAKMSAAVEIWRNEEILRIYGA